MTNIYTRLTTAQSDDIKAGYRALLVVSQQLRASFLRRRDFAQAFAAMGWSPIAARELAQIASKSFVYD